MSDFRTYHLNKRVPAVPMQPVVDPAEWSAASLRPFRDWAYRVSAQDQDELLAAVAHFRKLALPLPAVNAESFPLPRLKHVLADIRRELMDGRGIVMVRDFPIDRLDREGVALAYMGFGAYLGEKMMQNRHGHVLGHVKDLGENYGTSGRSYNTSAEVRFHSDACDYVGLLCLHPAKKGGNSRVASSVTLYNRMLERRPDLVEVLTQDFYRSHNGEMTPGTSPWYKQPIFCFTDGYFSAIGAGSTIDKVLRLPGVPPLTPQQQEAIALYRSMVEEFAVDIEFQAGDIQFLANQVTLHSRRAFEDWPEPHRRRHLLRLWLRDRSGRPIPKEQRGSRRDRGVQIEGLKMCAPLDVEVATA
ncbi:MAG TPA: TauD/TfdA family dioxygenase [Xanthobacteraceae bacterium]